MSAIHAAAAPLPRLLRALLRRPRAAPIQALRLSQPLLEHAGRLQAYLIYRRARRSCPAYRAFLAAHPHAAPRHPGELHQLPITDKASYVQPYSVEQRCYGGAIPPGAVLDESSGSSGAPNNWVRSPAERAETRRAIQTQYRLLFGHANSMVLNCFALGPWATGMTVSAALADLATIKSIGPDQPKLEATLRQFGPGYRYIVLGYPPFLKQFVDTTGLDLRGYQLAAVVGGEGMSEPLRGHLLGRFGQVISSYGASDLEINIGTETALTQALRQRCQQDVGLCAALFGSTTPPMIFQYNPLEHLIETTEAGELVFSVCRPSAAAPKLRYNLHDTGGTLRYRELTRLLALHGIAVGDLAARRAQLPLLYVFGRSDATVPFYGAKVGPADVEAAIAASPALVRAVRGFQLLSSEDAQANRRLLLRLECYDPAALDAGDVRAALLTGLTAANQDFREALRFAAAERVDVTLHPIGAGPFAGEDSRIKRRYLPQA